MLTPVTSQANFAQLPLESQKVFYNIFLKNSPQHLSTLFDVYSRFGSRLMQLKSTEVKEKM